MLAGIGKALRLYEMGKKALLRKCENNVSLNTRQLFFVPAVRTWPG